MDFADHLWRIPIYLPNGELSVEPSDFQIRLIERRCSLEEIHSVKIAP